MICTNQLPTIPESPSTVSVSIIDTSVRFQQWDLRAFVEMPKIAGHEGWSAPSWSFKIVHPQIGMFLFDLGVRLDWETGVPTRSINIIKRNGWSIKLGKDVAQILAEHGEELADVKGIFWSHWHWDHVGSPATFPSSVKLIVGPGFKADILPGWPEDPEGRANSDAWSGRVLEEVEIPQDQLKIGDYDALDYFGDGSFYLLDSPGHTVGHICALARTTSTPDEGSTFIFMGGDVAHLIAQFRPSSLLPLPDEIRPDPQKPIENIHSFCPCDGYVAIHPKHSRDKPYYKGLRDMATNADEAEKSTQKLESLDADDRIFTIIAHDNKLDGVIDVYPAEANDWKAKGWKELSHWRFLGDFQPDTGH